MQGTAADIIKLAMIEVDQWLSDKSLDTQMVMQVHDELILEVPNESVESIMKSLCEIMQDVVTLKVPLIVDAAHADNWSAAH
jgi:DNA polymerase-1